MDNSMNKNTAEKVEELILCLLSVAGLLFMVVYWQ